MQNSHVEKTDINWVCIYILSGMDWIGVIIYFLLLISLFRTSSGDKVSFILQIEITLSCLFHQISYTPSYITYIDTKVKEILCNIQVFIDNTSNMSTMIFGGVIAFLLYKSAKGKPIQSFNVLIISSSS